METHVLVEVAGVTEGSMADATLEGLVSGVRPKVDRQSVLPRVQLPAERAVMSRATLFPVPLRGSTVVLDG